MKFSNNWHWVNDPLKLLTGMGYLRNREAILFSKLCFGLHLEWNSKWSVGDCGSQMARRPFHTFSFSSTALPIVIFHLYYLFFHFIFPGPDRDALWYRFHLHPLLTNFFEIDFDKFRLARRETFPFVFLAIFPEEVFGVFFWCLCKRNRTRAVADSCCRVKVIDTDIDRHLGERRGATFLYSIPTQSATDLFLH